MWNHHFLKGLQIKNKKKLLPSIDGQLKCSLANDKTLSPLIFQIPFESLKTKDSPAEFEGNNS
jgi:hypothetical protein